jgi:hypothetical protein
MKVQRQSASVRWNLLDLAIDSREPWNCSRKIRQARSVELKDEASAEVPANAEIERMLAVG